MAALFVKVMPRDYRRVLETEARTAAARRPLELVEVDGVAAFSVSGKSEHAPSRSAPPTKGGRDSQVVPREARLLGAREGMTQRGS